MNLRFVAICLALAALPGCTQSPAADPDPIASYRLDWAKLADGSSFAQTAGNGNGVGMRCWPQGKDYLCLRAATTTTSGLTMTNVARTFEGALPAIAMPASDRSSGYRCNYVLEAHEEIGRDGQTLLDNDLSKSPPWTPRYVAKFIAENSIAGGSHFACLDILKAVQSGSLASLGSTAVKRGMAGS